MGSFPFANNEELMWKQRRSAVLGPDAAGIVFRVVRSSKWPHESFKPTTLARPDFQGVYLVDLFRLFLPTLDELPLPTVDVRAWYFQRAMDIIWNLGLNVNPNTAGTRTIQYEAIQGAAAYVDDRYGGEFQLRRFIKTMFGTVNRYDLAGIAQLAMAIIMDPVGVEAYNYRWIFCDGYGYIPDGPLIG
jgi:hypothetical protein